MSAAGLNVSSHPPAAHAYACASPLLVGLAKTACLAPGKTGGAAAGLGPMPLFCVVNLVSRPTSAWAAAVIVMDFVMVGLLSS